MLPVTMITWKAKRAKKQAMAISFRLQPMMADTMVSMFSTLVKPKALQVFIQELICLKNGAWKFPKQSTNGKQFLQKPRQKVFQNLSQLNVMLFLLNHQIAIPSTLLTM